jgi:hypothetical protein
VVHPERLHEQKRCREEQRARDREPGIVTMLTENSSHVSPIGA